ncbi:MAG: hypothetical protein LBI12_08085 [Treponema sp.]|jgi:hypothetical protein|nr:hypothetical protein [Treponema sp.]
MTKRASVLILLVFLSPSLFGDPAVLQTYMQRFNRGDMTVKAQTLRSAASDNRLNESAGLLFEYALNYALENYIHMDNLSGMNNIIDLSVRGLRNTSGGNHNLMWRLFLEYPETSVRARIMVALGTLGKNDGYIINNINNYLTEMNYLFLSGNNIDYQIVSACIAALMELGDSSSYPVLFSVMCAGYPEVIASEASGAIDQIDGNLKQFLYNIIERNPPEEKFIAFKAGMNSDRLSSSERGQLAEFALQQALAAYGDNADLRAMRYSAIWTLTYLRWTSASTLAIDHYFRVLEDYVKGDVSKTRLIEAIACLGAVGNSDAALVLGLQLGLINSGTEGTRLFDTDITITIIQALGLIGSSSVYDHLLYTSIFSGNDNIRAAAKEAINQLKW